MWLICEDGIAINSDHTSGLTVSPAGIVKAIQTTGRVYEVIETGSPSNALQAIKRLTAILNAANGIVGIDLSNDEDARYIVLGAEDDKPIPDMDAESEPEPVKQLTAWELFCSYRNKAEANGIANPTYYVEWLNRVMLINGPKEG